jgi:hypothetical protein
MHASQRNMLEKSSTYRSYRQLVCHESCNLVTIVWLPQSESSFINTSEYGFDTRRAASVNKTIPRNGCVWHRQLMPPGKAGSDRGCPIHWALVHLLTTIHMSSPLPSLVHRPRLYWTAMTSVTVACSEEQYHDAQISSLFTQIGDNCPGMQRVKDSHMQKPYCSLAKHCNTLINHSRGKDLTAFGDFQVVSPPRGSIFSRAKIHQ